VHYSPEVPAQPPFAADGSSSGEFPESAAWAREELSLPMFETLTSAEVARVCEVCAELLVEAA
jgi:dTDP-4-amino-4,6-dideoxygalactose transaminase